MREEKKQYYDIVLVYIISSELYTPPLWQKLPGDFRRQNLRTAKEETILCEFDVCFDSFRSVASLNINHSVSRIRTDRETKNKRQWTSPLSFV